MEILRQWSRERYGNDSILRFNLLVVQEWDDKYLQLRENHNGWSGRYASTEHVCVSDGYCEESAKSIVGMVDELTDGDDDFNDVLQEVMSYVDAEWCEYFSTQVRKSDEE